MGEQNGNIHWIDGLVFLLKGHKVDEGEMFAASTPTVCLGGPL